MTDFHKDRIELVKKGCSGDVQSQIAMLRSGLVIICLWLLVQK